MAEKKYLDYAGLSHYDVKIKELITSGDSTTLSSAKAYTDEKIGNLGTGIATVAAGILAEKTRAEGVEAELAENLGVASKEAIGTEGEEGYQAAVTATGLNAKVEALEAALGEDGSVAEQISDAIAELKNEDTAVTNQFVTAVSEENGVITVSRAALTADDIPELTLAKITDAGTAASAAVATVDIGAEDEEDTALPTVAQVKSYVASEVADIAGAMHFIDTYDSLDAVANDEDYTPAAGDVIIVGTKEYVYNGAIWKELGDEGDHLTKGFKIAGIDCNDDITADELKSALNVDDLATAVGVATVKDEEGVITTAGTGLTKRIEDLEAVNATADTYVAITDNEIDALFDEPTNNDETGA